MHFLLMVFFAAVVAIVMASIDPERILFRDRLLYGLKVFGAFVGIGLLIGWVMYFIPL
jgi:hypothetical protein